MAAIYAEAPEEIVGLLGLRQQISDGNGMVRSRKRGDGLDLRVVFDAAVVVAERIAGHGGGMAMDLQAYVNLRSTPLSGTIGSLIQASQAGTRPMDAESADTN